jgi:protocatechuate 3,4-dioxygenase alpha subunit
VADNQTPELFGQTPWQTLGPFFHYALPWKGGADLISGSDLGARPELMPAEHDLLHASGQRGPVAGDLIEIVGRVLDGAGEPLPDALVEIWQADAAGSYDGALEPEFPGFGRAATGEDGTFRFRTIRPGRVPGPGNTLQAAHIAVGVLGRGIIKRLVTRLYFEDGEGLEDDPILALVPPGRRSTLIARRSGEGVWRFDIRLQGEHETVFFDV